MTAPKVKSGLWKSVWPPEVIRPDTDAEREIERLQKTPREQWSGSDWQLWARFLEWAGGQLAAKLDEMRAVAADLAAAVPAAKKRGRKAKPPTHFILSAGVLGIASTPTRAPRKPPGRRADESAVSELKALAAQVELRMKDGNRGREAVLREMLKQKMPRARQATIAAEARNLSRKLSGYFKRIPAG